MFYIFFIKPEPSRVCWRTISGQTGEGNEAGCGLIRAKRVKVKLFRLKILSVLCLVHILAILVTIAGESIFRGHS